MQRFDEAEKYYTKTITLQPETKYPYICRGICRIKLGKLDAAREDLDQAGASGQKSEWTVAYWKWLVRGYLQLGDLKSAETLAHEWVVLHPKVPQPHLLLAECYTKQQRWDEALLELSLAIDLDPQASAPYERRANLYAARLDDSEKALADYAKCVELAPKNHVYRRKRSTLLSRLGRDEEARANLEVAFDLLTQEIKADPARPSVWLARAEHPKVPSGLEGCDRRCPAESSPAARRCNRLECVRLAPGDRSGTREPRSR